MRGTTTGMRRLQSYAAVALCSSALIISGAGAQSIWQHSNGDNSAGLELLIPSFNGNLDSYSGYILTLSGRYRISETNHLVVEVPFAHGAHTYQMFIFNGSGYVLTTVDEGRDVIGNPYIGLEFASPGSQFFGEVGARIPVTPEASFPASTVAVNGDIDRFEAYTPDIVQTSLAVNYNPKLASGLEFRLRFGPLFDVSLKRESGATELYLLYSEQVFYRNELIDVGLGFSGRTILTSPRTNDRTIDVFEIAAKVHVGQFLPGGTVRFPLDQSLSSIVSQTYGFSLEVLL